MYTNVRSLFRERFCEWYYTWSQLLHPPTLTSQGIDMILRVSSSDIPIYRAVQKTDTQFFGDDFGNSAPILTILSLLQAEIYGA